MTETETIKTVDQDLLDILEHYSGKENRISPQDLAKALELSVTQVWLRVERMKKDLDEDKGLPFVIGGDDIIGFWVDFGIGIEPSNRMTRARHSIRAERTRRALGTKGAKSHKERREARQERDSESYLEPRGRVII